MSWIDPEHPLATYHRQVIDREGRSEEELFRQWGRLKLASELPDKGFPAGSYQTVRLSFQVGSLGLDEDGGFKLSFRFVSDAGSLQMHDSSADNFVSATTTGEADLELQFERKGSRRPFQRTLRITVRNAGLFEGDEVELVLGDRSGGGRGWRQQTFVETPFPIRIAVDPFGSHLYQPLPRDLGWNILPARSVRFILVTPPHALKGQAFKLRLKAEDAWGNPLRNLAAEKPKLFILGPQGRRPLELEGIHDYGVWHYQVSLDETGVYFFEVDAEQASVSNGVTIVEATERPGYQHYWCDLHGQTGETVGVGTLEDYFFFARHFGFLDGCVHQGNDFQISKALWQTIKQASQEAYEAGVFVTFPGYEWSGTTTMGGDHNVLFFEEDPPLYRCSGWLDHHPFEETAPLSELYRRLKAHRALTIAHVGGRPAALTESDAEVEPLMEIHSAWGTFEWVYHEAFARGFKIGFVCNSDGHKCRPGASYPGAGVFGTLGGLTCVLSETCDREGFWKALIGRRCYGTTGQRIVVEADLNGQPIGSEFQMSQGQLNVRVLGTAPIVSIELLCGTEAIETFYPPALGPADTLLLRFGGARVRGRARMVDWEGKLSVQDNALTESVMNGVFSPNYGITDKNENSVTFHCVTTGNLVNLLLKFSRGLKGRLSFESNVTDTELELEHLGNEVTGLFTAPLDQRVEAAALHQASLPLDVKTTFALNVDHLEQRPYFLRVTQLDEGRAWTSPFYIACP